MKKVTGYKLTDGRIVEDKEEATKLQKEIDLKKAVREFSEKYGVYEEKNAIYTAIIENVEELRDILHKAL